MVPLSQLPRTLAAALRDVDHRKISVRISAVSDLARLASPPAKDDEHERAVTALVGALKTDASPDVRAAAAVALADARARESIEPVVLAVRDPDERVRQMALLAVGELAAADHESARAAIERGLDDRSPAIRFQALIALHRVGASEADERVVQMTSDSDAEVRFIALRIAEERFLEAEAGGARREPPERLIERARRLLDDESHSVRLVAAILLARFGVERGHAVIAQALNAARSPREPEDEYVAIELAGELRLEAARPGLERRAYGGIISQDPFCWPARIALARWGDERARRAIMKGLGAFTRDARTHAVAAAARARLHEALAPIRAMQGDAARADPDAVAEALSTLDAHEIARNTLDAR